MNGSPPRACVSVLMPCRDAGPFLDEAIVSVLADPLVLELLVADGGSQDGSLQCLEVWAERDARVRLISRHDQGPADALNRAFARARGTVIGWLNADDRYLSGAAGRAVAALDRHPTWLMVYGEGQHIDADGAVLDTYPTRTPEVGIEGFRDYCFLCQPTVFWRRSLGVLLGPFDNSLKTCFDFDYWIRAFAAFPQRIGHLAVLQAQTRRHDATLSVRQLPRAVLEATLLQARLFSEIRPHLLEGYVEERLSGSLPPAAACSQDGSGLGLAEMARSLPFTPSQLELVEQALRPLGAMPGHQVPP